ncbi:helix-turn-helix transcriptional regulator [Actinomadura parmotrematis]|uniref:Helix-turn-helix transcriptional regulator n=1 Tax=Actinomadura parmotrematis TaxID=2864039 RepID=A0ABS7FWL4_9ACTN|nr:helix-turn-helix transcriptional regulator [Actinomadura parmotrematis]MBW8484661.1 helix-turn-helix transcriptional regulator [Actinomadura parmotrematis]
MTTPSEIGEFLRSRRARLSPETAGIDPGGTGRRVPGLRREELAKLAGISADYYVRLEQGRNRTVSEEVLDAVAAALRLDGAEREYLFRIARPARRRDGAPVEPPQRVREGLYRLLETVDDVAPALILGRRTDVLAANVLARALLVDWEALPRRDRNVARFVFLDGYARSLLGNWDEVAWITVTALRLEAGRHPGDPLLTDLIGELSVKSEDFGRLWAGHEVANFTGGLRVYRHPVVGEITLPCESLTFPTDPDQTLCIHTVPPGSPAADSLRLLANWATRPGGLAPAR